MPKITHYSAPCTICILFRQLRGLPPNSKHEYWQQKLPDGKWYHPTQFGKAFHKRALDQASTTNTGKPKGE